MQHRDEKVARLTLKDGKVLLISNLVITPRYLHPNYLCKPGPGVAATSELVTIFELLEKDEGIPSFTGRWDGGQASRRPLDLEIDIAGVPIGVIRKFRNNSDGYDTHHFDSSPDTNRRLYEISIETPSGLIFEGEIAFFSTHEPAPHAESEFDAALDGAVNRAETLGRFPDRHGEERAASRLPRGPKSVAWLQEKLRSCLSYLSSRRQ